MSQQILTLATLGALDDGHLASDFDAQLRALVQDCINRPDVIVECLTSSKAPNRPITAYRMQTTANGGLRFQPDSPGSPDQNSLPFEDE